MHVIRHIVYGNQFLILTGNNAGDVFLKFVVMVRLDEALPAFDGEHDMDVDLRVGVGHASKMPLLTELENLFSFGATKISRLRRCQPDVLISQMIGQRVFVRENGFKDGFKLRALAAWWLKFPLAKSAEFF